MPRLGYTAPDHEVTERIRQRRGGKLTALDGLLLHSPEFADGWNGMLRAVRERSTLPAGLREAVILRVAAINGADYEWAAHLPVGRAAGLSDADLEAILEGGQVASDDLGPALRYAEAMTRDVVVPDEIFEAVRDAFDDQQILELTVTIATYNMVSRLLVALDVSAGDTIQL
jgi:4-carboxymuconolactone decarboxylase